MTVGQDLMEKYPIGVSERIAKEIDDAIRKAVEEDRNIEGGRLAKWFAICFLFGMLADLGVQYLLRN